MAQQSLHQRLGSEFIGTALLLATVIGSGIMGERLAGGNVAIALLGNTIPTGAILVVLITMLAPISGAHFNPAVTAVFAIKGDMSTSHRTSRVRRVHLQCRPKPGQRRIRAPRKLSCRFPPN
jgi:glycerol uptake facilitator-like aquaporin